MEHSLSFTGFGRRCYSRLWERESDGYVATPDVAGVSAALRRCEKVPRRLRDPQEIRRAGEPLCPSQLRALVQPGDPSRSAEPQLRVCIGERSHFRNHP